MESNAAYKAGWGSINSGTGRLDDELAMDRLNEISMSNNLYTGDCFAVSVSHVMDTRATNRCRYKGSVVSRQADVLWPVVQMKGISCIVPDI